MKPKISSILLSAILLFSYSYKSIAQGSGEESFKQVCSACHTVGGGKLVGPDLKNVNQRHTEEWLVSFIKSSQTVIKSGDKYADSIFNAFNKVVMPDQTTLDDAKIKDIIAYITDKSSGNTETTATTETIATAATDANTTTNSDSIYTTTNIILFSIIIFLMIVIVFLSRVIKKLSNQLMDFYSSDRSFY